MANVDIGRYSKRLVQYFWDPLPRNEEASPIWCLGRPYDSKSRPSSPSEDATDRPAPPLSVSHGSTTSSRSATGDGTSQNSSEDESARAADASLDADNDGGWPAPFLDDFEARFWLTYRSNFAAIPRSQDPNAANAMSFGVRLRSQLSNQTGFSSDTGWGCMIRSGQSLLANALQVLRLGRDWRRGLNPQEERQILSLFADDPKAPFSIHRFVEHGAAACGKHPGEWFGPSATARCIQALTNGHEEAGLRIYITGDGSDVYEDSFMKTAKDQKGFFRPTMVLVGIRLGIDRVTPVYWEALKASLQLPQSIGIAGGRPSASHYFVGVQGSNFFYLDPHNTRPFLPLHSDLADYTQEDVDSCHTRRLRRLHIKEMDPSMLIAFLIRDEADWRSWRKAVTDVHGKPVIHVADSEPIIHGGQEREGAIDEVEAFDDEDEGLQ
ncbi:Peptidase C54 [Lasiodiplodia theobromae]|uniref:Cysteine protease n=2 Tax=Lasiodiplodia TaxID=66739 RepID=A0A5N5DF19_9PEZI|nr:Peptidase C54 [Lasiodiplodia theobromae]KAB2576281.1 putative cysteine protease atg4 [Lasiodiplodia theobromae]KAF4535173.1 Peptidase C54 [Lasiodiplodia theobromae]KAF9638303.1 Peptidase C54 [Lasiodiplodia theobromae]KAK0650271.1 putative cysteine protease atg4 [Lasiodiplodia hormozganensis]